MMSRAPLEWPWSPTDERSGESSLAGEGLRVVRTASFVVLAIDAVLATLSPLWFVLDPSELATYWWLILVYGLALGVCLMQVVRGRGVWWLVGGLAIATAGSRLDSWVYELDRTAGPSLLPLVLLVLLAGLSLRRRGKQPH